MDKLIGAELTDKFIIRLLIISNWVLGNRTFIIYYCITKQDKNFYTLIITSKRLTDATLWQL